MAKKALITGVTGFAGSFLADVLIKNNQEVYGLARDIDSAKNLVGIKDKIKLFSVDLFNPKALDSIIRDINPDFVFHLAASAPTGESFKNPSYVLQNNIISELNILEALKSQGLLNTKTLIVSSGEVYGAIKKSDLPLDEDTPLRPVNPYSVSKIAQEFLAMQYFLTYKLNIVTARPFNHIGPRQTANFVVSAFARQIAEIEKGKKGAIIKVGNLNAKRDFTDVRDVVIAYYLLANEEGNTGEIYNIGSGKSYKISEILDILLSFSKLKIKIEVDKALFRPVDVPEIICDNNKIKKLTNWNPSILLEKSLFDTLDYWRNIS